MALMGHSHVAATSVLLFLTIKGALCTLLLPPELQREEFPGTLHSGSCVFTPSPGELLMIACPETSVETPWVALVVRPRAERKVQAGLGNAGLETFVPWHGVRHRWSDRIKVT